MTRDDLRGTPKGHRCIFPIQCAMFTYEPMYERALNDIRPKGARFNFLPMTYYGEVAKLT